MAIDPAEVERLAQAIVAGQEVAVVSGRSTGQTELHAAVARRVREIRRDPLTGIDLTKFGPFDTLSEIRQANHRIGQHWFEADGFFDTTYPDGDGQGSILYGRFFVTGDKPPRTATERYTVRVALDDGRIETVGDLWDHDTPEAARLAVKNIMIGAVLP